ncbi:VVA0879 family protein [Streptomyces sp. NPDC007084]|uniref:VVA0879 family protein n=1 Tax=Streptomyces sp. NPDC007084 TaxID=3154313 RepID=UPI0034511645
MSPAHRRLTQAELWAEATARFGNDPLKWRFRCPSCGDVASGADFKKVLDDSPSTHAPTRRGRPVIWSDVLGRECIGRHLGALGSGIASRGCGWAAYGLIAGPWFVELPDTERAAPSFALAPAPATVPAVTGGAEVDGSDPA